MPYCQEVRNVLVFVLQHNKCKPSQAHSGHKSHKVQVEPYKFEFLSKISSAYFRNTLKAFIPPSYDTKTIKKIKNDQIEVISQNDNSQF